ncbi:MAG: carbohydrate ABC transporter permease [Lachnospiraceae bacterium]|jgi:multiple sugar transport system permease protein|nr:carbohydrate ABC transporter permease [Lachnospiraceae bacterium]
MTKGKIRRIINIILLAALLLIVLTPVWWAVVLSFDRAATTALPEFSWLPHEFSTFNYKAASRLIDLPRYYLNTLIITAVNTFVSVFFAMMCGFAFAKGKFWGKKFLYVFMLAVMMVPFESRMVPLFIQYRNWGMLNSWLPLILGQFAYVYGIFFARQNIATIPDSLVESVYLDGGGVWRVFFSIILPLSKPVMATLGILQAIAHWNAYLWPLVVIRDSSKQVISVGVALFNAQQDSVYYGPRMAVAVLSAIPLAIMFLFLQKYIVASVAVSGIKQ